MLQRSVRLFHRFINLFLKPQPKKRAATALCGRVQAIFLCALVLMPYIHFVVLANTVHSIALERETARGTCRLRGRYEDHQCCIRGGDARLQLMYERCKSTHLYMDHAFTIHATKYVVTSDISRRWQISCLPADAAGKQIQFRRGSCQGAAIIARRQAWSSGSSARGWAAYMPPVERTFGMQERSRKKDYSTGCRRAHGKWENAIRTRSYLRCSRQCA